MQTDPRAKECRGGGGGDLLRFAALDGRSDGCLLGLRFLHAGHGFALACFGGKEERTLKGPLIRLGRKLKNNECLKGFLERGWPNLVKLSVFTHT